MTFAEWFVAMVFGVGAGCGLLVLLIAVAERWWRR